MFRRIRSRICLEYENQENDQSKLSDVVKLSKARDAATDRFSLCINAVITKSLDGIIPLQNRRFEADSDSFLL